MAYLARHNITNNNDKIISLKMNMHARQGDAKHILYSILDDNINYKMITFEPITLIYLKFRYVLDYNIVITFIFVSDL